MASGAKKLSRPTQVRQTGKTLKNHLPESFFAVLGTWEDDRDSEEILRDIRREVPQREREAID